MALFYDRQKYLLNVRLAYFLPYCPNITLFLSVNICLWNMPKDRCRRFLPYHIFSGIFALTILLCGSRNRDGKCHVQKASLITSLPDVA